MQKVRDGAIETGFLRPKADGSIEWLLTHNTGFAEVYYGQAGEAKVEVSTDAVVRTKTAKEYVGGHRLYGLVEGDLLWAYDMAAVGAGAPAASVGSTDPAVGRVDVLGPAYSRSETGSLATQGCDGEAVRVRQRLGLLLLIAFVAVDIVLVSLALRPQPAPPRADRPSAPLSDLYAVRDLDAHLPLVQPSGAPHHHATPARRSLGRC